MVDYILQNDVENIFYLASDEEMKKCKLSDGQVPIVCSDMLSFM